MRAWAPIAVLAILGLVSLAWFAPWAERGWAARPSTSWDAPRAPGRDRPMVGPGAGSEARHAARDEPAPIDSTARIVGRVRYGTGEGLVGVCVRATSDRDRWTALSGPDGRYVLRGPAPGLTLEIDLDPGSLPVGHLGPWRGGSSLPQGQSTYPFGYDPGQVDVPPEGGDVQYDLRVFRGCRIHGHIELHGVGPIEGVQISLITGGGIPRAGLPIWTRSVRGGYFEMWAYPGWYRWTLHPRRELTEGGGGRPGPGDVTLIEGEELDLGTLVIGTPGKRLTGRVVDQFGEPMADLDMKAFHADPVPPGVPPLGESATATYGRTGPDGVFTLDGLTPGRYGLVADPAGYKPGRELGSFRLRDFVETRFVEIGAEDEELLLEQDIVAQVSQVFTLDVEVVPGEGWGEGEWEGAELLRRLIVRVDLLDPEQELELPPYIVRRCAPRVFELQDSCTFRWRCETPFPPVQVTLKRRHGDTLEAAVIVPVPLTTGVQRFVVDAPHGEGDR